MTDRPKNNSEKSLPSENLAEVVGGNSEVEVVAPGSDAEGLPNEPDNTADVMSLRQEIANLEDTRGQIQKKSVEGEVSDIKKFPKTEEKKKSILGIKEAYHRVIDAVNSIVGLPAKGVISSIPTQLRTYGGYFKKENGELRYYIGNTFVNWVDRVGDKFFRTFDDHRARDGVMLKTLSIRGIMDTIKQVMTPKRSRRTVPEVWENIKNLELTDEFDISDDGEYLIIKNPDFFKKGIMLLDIVSPSGVEDPETQEKLKEYDLNEAIKMSSELLGKIHSQGSCGIGEFLPHDVMLSEDMTESRILPPDIVYYDNTSVNEQKALDLLDFCYSLVAVRLVELKKSDNTQSEKFHTSEALQLIQVVLDSYPRKDILDTALRLDNRGRFALSAHNNARLGFNDIDDAKDVYARIRATIFNYGKENISALSNRTNRKSYMSDDGRDILEDVVA